ncbi:hypothetical protein JQ594_21300 [Bradyrhizobium manausense]|uniref:hypothetical protein n=1 Tax=Bradyrhizobium manausense TaxID=989370 RepID=UPI001BAB9D5D|nr:hypothetical protein [Bradyrhizobium manausense]MBR0688477.1 hypothetical protein [Bradyrhizobium manausense]MBR0720865.1 hypothetical protein [Bradyrhizobium manausense]
MKESISQFLSKAGLDLLAAIWRARLIAPHDNFVAIRLRLLVRSAPDLDISIAKRTDLQADALQGVSFPSGSRLGMGIAVGSLHTGRCRGDGRRKFCRRLPSTRAFRPMTIPR